MATLLSDNFDRANSTSVVGAPQIGPTPTVPAGTAGISSNQLYQSSGPANVVWDLGTPNVDLTATFSGMSSSNGVSFMIGYAGATIYWLCSFRTNGVELYRQETAGFYTVAFNGTALDTAGVLARVAYKDRILRAWADGVQVIRWDTDAPVTATSHGIRISNYSPVRADNILGVDSTNDDVETTGETLDPSIAADFYMDPGFVYRGRDLKTQDAAAGA